MSEARTHEPTQPSHTGTSGASPVATSVMLLTLLATVLLLALPTACAPAPPSGPPDIEGSASAVSSGTPGSGVLGTMLVVSAADGGDTQPGSYDRASVRVTDETELFAETADGGISPATFGDIVEGGRVRVWFTGPVAESYPVQATALAVVILK